MRRETFPRRAALIVGRSVVLESKGGLCPSRPSAPLDPVTVPCIDSHDTRRVGASVAPYQWAYGVCGQPSQDVCGVVWCKRGSAPFFTACPCSHIALGPSVPVALCRCPCSSAPLIVPLSRSKSKSARQGAKVRVGGRLKRNAHAVQPFGCLAVLETHALRYQGHHCCPVV